jgi:hypothetical protein
VWDEDVPFESVPHRARDIGVVSLVASGQVDANVIGDVQDPRDSVCGLLRRDARGPGVDGAIQGDDAGVHHDSHVGGSDSSIPFELVDHVALNLCIRPLELHDDLAVRSAGYCNRSAFALSLANRR